MYTCQWRDSFSCLRNLFFLFIVHSFIIYGFAQIPDQKNNGKIFLENYQREDKIKIFDSTRKETTGPNKSKVTNIDKPYHDFEKQHLNSQRQKRNAPVADEDLFEFMVRIANTPVEWERIRRVLSRIKEENSPSGLSNLQPTLPHRTTNQATNISSDSQANATSSWPSNVWIENFVNNRTESDLFSEEEYFEVDDEGEENENNINDVYTIEQRKTVTNKTNTNDLGRQMIIPNEKLPNFVYRRVKPDSSQPENSAYIAVSVVSANAANKKQSIEATVLPKEGNEWYENEYKYFNQLESRQRHSRRKYDKT